MKQESYHTKSSLEKLKKEYDLLQKKSKVLSTQIGDAIAQGDLSENAEYHAAKKEQAFLGRRMRALQNEIAKARIIDERNINTSRISILTKVKMKNQQTGQILTYKLVPSQEADIKQGTLSIDSPIAKGLLNKRVGDIATIHVPAGKLVFEILKISL